MNHDFLTTTSKLSSVLAHYYINRPVDNFIYIVVYSQMMLQFLTIISTVQPNLIKQKPILVKRSSITIQ